MPRIILYCIEGFNLDVMNRFSPQLYTTTVNKQITPQLCITTVDQNCTTQLTAAWNII